MASLKAKLIVVDGFAGSGKSTSAQRLWLNLVRGRHAATWHHEHESNHPIFEYGEVDELLHLEPGPFEERVLAGWDAVAHAADAPDVRIIEGSFLQLPVGVMLALNVPAARIQTMLRRLDAAMARAGASLVYLFRPDLRAALIEIGDARGVHWLEAMTAALGQSPYGRTHRVRSLDGLIDYYRRQRAIVDSAFPRLTVRRLAIDVSGRRWEHYERQMTTFLGIRRVTAAHLRPADLLRHAGPYRGTTTGKRCVMTTDGRTLYLQLPATPVQPLVRVGDGWFCLRSLPIDIRFTYRKSGEARRFAYESRMANEILADTSWVRA